MIMNCTCRHPYQDQMYGAGKRVHNPSGKKDNNLAKCTVCGTAKSIPTPAKTKVKEATL